MKLWKTLKKKLNIQRHDGRDPSHLVTSFSEDGGAAAAVAAAPGAANRGFYETEFIDQHHN